MAATAGSSAYRARRSFRSIPSKARSILQPATNAAPPAKGRIEVYDFEEQKHETLIENVSSFDISLDGKTLIYRAGNRLRVLEAGKKPNGDGNGPSRKSGWLDLDRIRVLG